MYYFFNVMIIFKDFDSSLLKIYKKSYQNIVIYNIGYITIKKIDDYENIYRVNPLYLIIGRVIGHTEEKNGSKYLVLDSVGENKEVLKNTQNFGIKNEIETINGSKTGEYGKNSMKIKFDLDDNLLLNKQLTFRTITIVVRSVFEDEGKVI